MKKITLAILATALAISANAQKKFTFGIKGGLNVVTITNMDFVVSENQLSWFQTENKSSFYAGAFAEWRFAKFFALSPELVYSGQGMSSTANIQLSNVDFVYTESNVMLSYINLPVMAKLYPLRWLSIDLGPQAGLLVAAKTRSVVSTDVMGPSVTETTDSKGDFKNIDFSLGMGLTCNFSKHIFMQARYNLGLTEIPKGSDNDKGHKNSVIQFGMGFRL